MNGDIGATLREWPYDEHEGLQVRRIPGADGRPLLQMRVDLGIIQMELTGRPDGARPHGCESLLAYKRQQTERYREEHGWYEGFDLDRTACTSLRQEALQYYHRRIACLTVQEYDQSIADAEHNLEILDLLKAFARGRDDWLVSEQYRPFILSHRIQAEALQDIQIGQINRAIRVLKQGLDQLRQVFAEQERADEFDQSVEAAVLTDLQRKLESRFKMTRRQRLEMLLDDALRREALDEVTDLRAQLREIDPEA